jgi:glutamine synthetase
VLNTIVANQLVQFKIDVDKQLKKGTKKEVALINVLREYVKQSKAVRFEGNGYSDEWVNEAEKRGLANVKTTPEALDAYVTDKAKKLFIENGIFTEVELEARHEIDLENYIKKVQIEARVMGDLAYNHVIPTAVAYQNKLIQNIKGLKDIGIDVKGSATLETVIEISNHINEIKKNVDLMVEARKVANKIENTREKAINYCHDVRKFFDVIRYNVDKLELLVDDEDWPLVKYRELLFVK